MIFAVTGSREGLMLEEKPGAKEVLLQAKAARSTVCLHAAGHN